MTQKRVADLVVVPTPRKVCGWCKVEKPLFEFGRQRRAPDGRQTACRDCYAQNERKHHNATAAPPKRRWSPYDVIDVYLSDIERALYSGDATRALYTVGKARSDLNL